MPNKHPFDDQLRQAFQGFEPEVNAPWDALERELDGVKSAPEPSPANTANRWAVAAACGGRGCADVARQASGRRVDCGCDRSSVRDAFDSSGACALRERDRRGFFRVGLGSVHPRNADVQRGRVGRGLGRGCEFRRRGVCGILDAMSGALDNIADEAHCPRGMTRFPVSKCSLPACHSHLRRARRVRGWKSRSNCQGWTSR